MVQALNQSMTFETFIETKPEHGRYELHRGAVVEMQPTGAHETVISFLAIELGFEIRRQQLPFALPKQALIKIPGEASAFLPDLLVLKRDVLSSEPWWAKASTITRGESVHLVVEVTSTNWRDDYYVKLAAYEELGIPEYWIVDYGALGGRKFIGQPKTPTLSLYTLVEQEYQVQLFRGDDRILSPAFPNLSLTANQIFQAAQGSSA